MPFKSRRTEDLRKGRISIPGAFYFLTWCTENRAHSLNDSQVQAIIRQAITNLELTGNGRLMAASIMPDHIHVLLELGTPLTISQVVGKLKAAITRAHSEIKWQENFFEHQLRLDDPIENYAFYIFMNPYSAGICRPDQTWSGWILSSTVQFEFETKVQPGGLPHPEWIEEAKRFGESLPPGAD